MDRAAPETNALLPGGIPSLIPSLAGVGLKARHYREIIDTLPSLGWFEVHSENYLCAGGPPHRFLEAVRRDYPISMHGIGLSLGSAEGLDRNHLARIRALADRYQPGLVSEHLSWSFAGGVFLNDLLPLPLTGETLALVSDNVSMMQDTLQRQILIENPSTYLRYIHSPIPEPEFLIALAGRTGCGILLDVNNVYVSARNTGLDAGAYIDQIPAHLIGEVHLAGHAVNTHQGKKIYIDDHGSRVAHPVWELFRRLIGRTGPKPALIEWDTGVPELDALMEEAEKADAILRPTVHGYPAESEEAHAVVA